MSRAQRRALVEREDAALPVSQQCRLLAVSRSSVYRPPAEVGEVDRAIMALIDRQYLARPYYSRRMAAWLATQGHVVNRKRVRRLMRLMGWWRSTSVRTRASRPRRTKSTRTCLAAS
jgi:putative transposase